MRQSGPRGHIIGCCTMFLYFTCVMCPAVYKYLTYYLLESKQYPMRWIIEASVNDLIISGAGFNIQTQVYLPKIQEFSMTL